MGLTFSHFNCLHVKLSAITVGVLGCCYNVAWIRALCLVQYFIVDIGVLFLKLLQVFKGDGALIKITSGCCSQRERERVDMLVLKVALYSSLEVPREVRLLELNQ